MKTAATCPSEPRVALGEISLRYMGSALRETPVGEACAVRALSPSRQMPVAEPPSASPLTKRAL